MSTRLLYLMTVLMLALLLAAKGIPLNTGSFIVWACGSALMGIPFYFMARSKKAPTTRELIFAKLWIFFRRAVALSVALLILSFIVFRLLDPNIRIELTEVFLLAVLVSISAGVVYFGWYGNTDASEYDLATRKTMLRNPGGHTAITNPQSTHLLSFQKQAQYTRSTKIVFGFVLFGPMLFASIIAFAASPIFYAKVDVASFMSWSSELLPWLPQLAHQSKFATQTLFYHSVILLALPAQFVAMLLLSDLQVLQFNLIQSLYAKPYFGRVLFSLGFMTIVPLIFFVGVFLLPVMASSNTRHHELNSLLFMVLYVGIGSLIVQVFLLICVVAWKNYKVLLSKGNSQGKALLRDAR